MMSQADQLPTGLGLRPMQESDLDFVLTLGAETPQLWLDEDQKFPFRRQDLAAWIEDEDKRAIIFELEQERIGFSLIDVDRSAAELESFVLTENYRGRGWGKQLFQKLLKQLEEQGADFHYLYTGLDNERAINFYKSLGFKTGKRLLMMYRGL